MNHITTNDLLEHLKWRYATKQFDPSKTIAPEIWTALEDALVLSRKAQLNIKPTSAGQSIAQPNDGQAMLCPSYI